MTQTVSDDSSDMASRKVFTILGSSVADGTSARLGKLALPGRRPIATPNFVGVTSRGVIPHLTPDNLAQFTNVESAYMGLEDFVDKSKPAIYLTEGTNSRPLHKFTAFPRDIATILAARRCPAVTPPAGNTSHCVNICTSSGFRNISVAEYAEATRKLQPDIVVLLADLLHTSQAPASKRQMRMSERTEEWMDKFLQYLDPVTRNNPGISIFAPVLPVELPIQWNYLRHLSEDVLGELSGLAVYDVNLLPELSSYNFESLPKLSLDPPENPHQILRQVALGIDVMLTPFVNNISDAGVALTFKFPPPADATGIQPLGIDMWFSEHKASLLPLVDSCTCYTCQKHHRAFINHLLNAKEMLGWTLLQVHNHHVLSEFFAGIREALGRGQSEFDKLAQDFVTTYDSELPAGTGERPRVRGYHFKSVVTQDKANKPTWQNFEANGDTAETPLEPDGDGQTLVEKGFADKADATSNGT